MKYTTYGFPLPDANDCAACVFGQTHNSECLGVDFEGERVYCSGMPGVIEQSRNTIERWLGR